MGKYNTHKKEEVMGNLEMKGNWNKIKGKLKEKYGELTDNDLRYVEGKEDQMLGDLQKKTGKTKKELSSEIRKIIDS